MAQLLSCLSPSTPLPPQVAGVVQNAQYAEDCAKHYCGEPWGPIAAKQTCARVALDKGETKKAYDNVVSAYNGFLNAIREEGGWVAPLIRTLTFEARVIAERADAPPYHLDMGAVNPLFRSCAIIPSSSEIV